MRTGFISSNILGYLLVMAALAVALSSCPQNQGQTTSTPRTKPFSKMQKAPPPQKPTLTSTEKAGDDTRYVISYQNTEFQVVAGEKGLFGVKVIAPDKNSLWSSLWIDFYPQTSRPRTHDIKELSGGDPRLEYISEDVRKYVLMAKELALIAAPQKPQIGEESKNPRGRKMKIEGLDLSPLAANEMAILAQTDRLFVTENVKYPVRPLPAEIQSVGHLRFGDALSQYCFTPEASWVRLRMGIRTYDVGLLVLKRGGRLVCYMDFFKLRDAYKDFDAMLTVDSGLLSLTRVGPLKPGEEKVVPKEFREDAGMLLVVMDNKLYEPPEEYKKALVTALTIINSSETSDTFSQVTERKGGIEDLLAGIVTPPTEAPKPEAPQPEAQQPKAPEGGK